MILTDIYNPIITRYCQLYVVSSTMSSDNNIHTFHKYVVFHKIDSIFDLLLNTHTKHIQAQNHQLYIHFYLLVLLLLLFTNIRLRITHIEPFYDRSVKVHSSSCPNIPSSWCLISQEERTNTGSSI